jgi:hypothetical protein
LPQQSHTYEVFGVAGQDGLHGTGMRRREMYWQEYDVSAAMSLRTFENLLTPSEMRDCRRMRRVIYSLMDEWQCLVIL